MELRLTCQPLRLTSLRHRKRPLRQWHLKLSGQNKRCPLIRRTLFPVGIRQPRNRKLTSG